LTRECARATVYSSVELYLSILSRYIPRVVRNLHTNKVLVPSSCAPITTPKIIMIFLHLEYHRRLAAGANNKEEKCRGVVSIITTIPIIDSMTPIANKCSILLVLIDCMRRAKHI